MKKRMLRTVLLIAACCAALVLLAVAASAADIVDSGYCGGRRYKPLLDAGLRGRTDNQRNRKDEGLYFEKCTVAGKWNRYQINSVFFRHNVYRKLCVLLLHIRKFYNFVPGYS